MRSNSETGITFRSFGGHSHDGVNSSKIDFSTYTEKELNDLKRILDIGSSPTYSPPRVVPYVPTWTASAGTPAVGNGTLTGSYYLTDKYLHFRIYLRMGSTTTYGTGGSTYYFALPGTYQIPFDRHQAAGTAIAFDNPGGASYRGVSMVAGDLEGTAVVNKVKVLFADNTGTYMGQAAPFTWAADDRVSIQGTIEIG